MRLRLTLLLLLCCALPAYATDIALIDRDGVTTSLVLTPANIGAATAAQGLKADSALQPTAGVGFYPASDDTHAAIEIDQIIHASTDDRQGAIHATTTGPDTHTGAAANWLEFINTGSLTGGFDSALTTILRNDSISGGTGDAQWWVAATPNSNTGNWVVNGGEINTLNAYADMGYQEDVYSAVKPTSGLYMVPESELNVGRGVGRSMLACVSSGNPYACCTGAGTGTCQNERGYNSTYGIMFGRSAGSDYGTGREYPASKWWVPIYVGKDATAPTGSSILLRGGTAANKSPGVAIKIKDYQTIGLDTSTATISGPAIKLGGSQTIADDAGNSVTVAQLKTAVGGGATDGDAFHKSGTSEIAGLAVKASPASTDLVVIEDSTAGYVKKQVQVGTLAAPTGGTVTGAVQLRSSTGTLAADDALVVDTTNHSLGLGAAAGTNSKFFLGQLSTDTAKNIKLRSINGVAAFYGQNAAGGTLASPTATGTNSGLLQFSAGGFNGSAWIDNAAQIKAFSGNSSIWSAVSTPTRWDFQTTPETSTSLQTVGRFGSNGALAVGSVPNPIPATLYVKGLNTPARVGAEFLGSGLNDFVLQTSSYTGTGGDSYVVVIDATGTPDTFKWSKNGGAYTTGVAITGVAQTLSDGVQVKWTATTGHTLNNQWTMTFPWLRRTDDPSGNPVEVVTNTGNVLIGTAASNGTSKLQVNGDVAATTFNGSPLGTAAFTPSTAYLGATAQATDSDKLDGQHGSYYAKADGATHAQGTSTTLDLNANDGFQISAASGTVSLTVSNLANGKYFDIEITSTSGALTLNSPLFTGASFPNGNNSATVSAGKSSHYVCKGTGSSTAKCYTLTESK